MSKTEALDVSIVLAAYNSSALIGSCVQEIMQIMDSTRYSYEIIVVDDRSQDETMAKVRELQREDSRIRLIRHRKNRGRGKTVYDGFRSARGRIVGYIDVDLNNPALYIYPLIVKIDRHGVDICTARRLYLSGLNPYLFLRYILSKGYSLLSRWYLNVPLKDTETGLKFFKKSSVLPLMKQAKSTGWFWDTEIMVLSYYKGLKIEELPTLFIRRSSYSTVRLLGTIFNYLLGLWNLKKRITKMRRQAE